MRWCFLQAAQLLLLAVPAMVLAQELGGQRINRDGWQIAEPGYTFHFPADHGPHPSFRTEWWYFTGNLVASDGREFGFELTFFRHSYRPPEPAGSLRAPFVTGDVKFAHFTVTDVSNRRFYASEKTSRGALGEAGFSQGQKLVWIDDWQVDFNGSFRLRAAGDQCAIDLQLEPNTSPVLQGDHGFSRKAAGPGRASYYYSIPILQTQGTVRVGASALAVTGTSWFDREWATNELAPQQAGWNWFAIQFNDGSGLMLYEMRLKDGGVDPFSNGKYVAANGQTTALACDDFQLTPTRFWQRDRSAPRYPVGWQITIPKLALSLSVSTPVDDQELRFSVHYWEGCIRLAGTKEGKPAQAVGYMELTGYKGSVPALSQK